MSTERSRLRALPAGALNFRDIMLAFGKLSKQQMAHGQGGDNIGFEFSGFEVGLHQQACLFAAAKTQAEAYDACAHSAAHSSSCLPPATCLHASAASNVA